MQISRRTSILYAALQTDPALMGGICDNSLSVGDIYVHDKETRPLYVKFTMSFLMSSVFLGLKISFSYKINPLCLVISVGRLQRTARQVGAPGGRGAADLWRGRGLGAGARHCCPWPCGSRRAVGNGCCCWTEPGGEKVSLPVSFLNMYVPVGKEFSYPFLVM